MLALISGIGAILPMMAAQGTEGSTHSGVTEQRVEQIAGWLPAAPKGPGKTASDRAFWTNQVPKGTATDIVARAEGLLKEKLEQVPDDLFLDYSKTGNRTRFQNAEGKRRGRLAPLVLAECVEYKGRFLPAIEELARALCAEKTWVLPAHDASLSNFRGQSIDIDLWSSHLGWNLALAQWLLGNDLSPEVRNLIRDNVARRVLDPYRKMVLGERSRNWWMDTTNNWNSVCLAGVTGAALAQVDDVKDRALFVAAAERYSRNFLAGFTTDGYCSEGVGYWNYGFGNYLILCETIVDATGGKLDLLVRPEARNPSLYGANIVIADGVCPAFADCDVKAKPSESILARLNSRLGLGLSGLPTRVLPGIGTLSDFLVYRFGSTPKPKAADATRAQQPRTWFEQAGVYIGRGPQLSVALKGGHNNEHHNHNDVGSFLVVVKRKPVLMDPGLEVYTSRTFSNRRYDSKMLNSFGHPVPVVGGSLQRTGASARGRVVSTRFKDDNDSLTFDISSAYAVSGLRRLTREFIYSRKGSLVVTDRMEAREPLSFEVALLTQGTWEQVSPKILRFRDGDAVVDVHIDTGAKPFTVEATKIEENAPVHPTRVAIRLNEPTANASVVLTVSCYRRD